MKDMPVGRRPPRVILPGPIGRFDKDGQPIYNHSAHTRQYRSQQGASQALPPELAAAPQDEEDDVQEEPAVVPGPDAITDERAVVVKSPDTSAAAPAMARP